MPKIKLNATAEPNSVVLQHEAIRVFADSHGTLFLETAWPVRKWIDDADDDAQLLVVTHPTEPWPNKQNCHIHNLVIRDRLRVLELQQQRNRAFVIATSAEITPND